MSERILEIISGDEKRFFDSSLEEIANADTAQTALVPSILGVGDINLNVPTLEQRVMLPSRHGGFFVARLPDTQPKRGKSAYEDPLYYNFEITGPAGIKIPVIISSIFTEASEEDYTQKVEGLAYFGVGGLAFMTDEKEFHCLFGPQFKHETFFDMGYHSSDTIRAHSSNKPTDHIKSFEVTNGKYIIVNDLSYHGLRESNPASYGVYNVNNAPELIGSIQQSKFETPLSVPLKLNDFGNFLPLAMGSRVYILQGGKGHINVYEILKIGTPEEKLERVKEIGGVNMPVQANLLQIITAQNFLR